MKHLSLLFLSFLLVQCFPKPADPIPVNPTLVQISGTTIGDDNVSIWEPAKTIDVNVYYTSIDTTTVPLTIDYPIAALYSEGDVAAFLWDVKGVPADFRTGKSWQQDLQKWAGVSTASINPLLITASLTVNASVAFAQANKSITRQTTLTLNKKFFTYDLYRLNFGMTRDQAKTSEVERFGIANAAWFENSPSLTEITHPGVNGNYTFYEFETNQLKAVSVASSNNIIDAYLAQLLRTLKAPTTVAIGPLTRDVVWNNGKLKFTLHSKEFARNTGAQKFVCVTFEKL